MAYITTPSSGVILVMYSSKNNKKRLKSGIFFFIDVILPKKPQKSRILSSFLDFFQPFRFTFADLGHHSQCSLLNRSSSLIDHLLYLLFSRSRQLFPVCTHSKPIHHLLPCRLPCFCVQFSFSFSSQFLSLTSSRTKFGCSACNHRTLCPLLGCECF